MKVITEERLRGLINKIIDRENAAKDKKDRFIFGVLRVQLSEIIEACQELDTLTVTRLRPMSDIPIGEIVLMKIKLMDSFYATVISEDDYLDGCDGWIPMPKYEPEKV